MVNKIGKAFATGLLFVIVLTGLYLVHWHLIMERKLHYLVRKEKWSEATAHLDELHSSTGVQQQQKKKRCGQLNLWVLVNRLGFDGKTPIQIALELGMTKGYQLSHARRKQLTKSKSMRRLAAGSSWELDLTPPSSPLSPSKRRSRRLSGARPVCLTDHEDPLATVQENVWRTLVNRMLDPSHFIADRDCVREERGSHASEQAEDPLGEYEAEEDESDAVYYYFWKKFVRRIRSCRTIGLADWMIFTWPFFFSILWQAIFSGTHIGAAIDHGDFPDTADPPSDIQQVTFALLFALFFLLLALREHLIFTYACHSSLPQQCGTWCMVLGTLQSVGAFVFMFIPVTLTSATFVRWWDALYGVVVRTSDLNAAAALLGITLTCAVTWLCTVIDGLLNFCGLSGAVRPARFHLELCSVALTNTLSSSSTSSSSKWLSACAKLSCQCLCRTWPRASSCAIRTRSRAHSSICCSRDGTR